MDGLNTQQTPEFKYIKPVQLMGNNYRIETKETGMHLGTTSSRFEFKHSQLCYSLSADILIEIGIFLNQLSTKQ